MKLFLLQLAAALLSAVFLVSLWAPFAEESAVWFALVPLLLVIRKVAPRRAALIGFLSGLAAWCGQLWWMTALTQNSGPWFLVYPALLGLSAVLACFTALFAVMSSAFRRRVSEAGPLAVVLTLGVDPLLWAATESLRSHVFTGFAWNPLGLAFTSAGLLPLAQVAAVGGASAASALAVAANGAVATFLTRIWRAVTRTLPAERAGRLWLTAESVLPFVLVLMAFGWGLSRIRAYDGTKRSRTATFVVERTDVPCVFSDAPAPKPWETGAPDIVSFFKADLWLWPESALATVLPYDGETSARMTALARQAQTPVMAGCTFIDTERRLYNAAVLFTDRGADLRQVYAKRHLVPFGEYIPFDKTFPVLQKFIPTGFSCTPGDRVTAVRLPSGLVVGPLICFEDTVESVARQSVLDGAEVLVNMSNDAWYAPSAETAQHAHQAVMRSIETGVPTVRSTNRGDNTFTDAVGRTVAIDRIPTRVKVTETPFASCYLAYGEWTFGVPAIVFLAVSAAFFLLGSVRRERV